MPAPIVPAPSTPMTLAARPSRPALPASSVSLSTALSSDIARLVAAAQAGTSALMPVIARPMISFWICEVPS